MMLNQYLRSYIRKRLVRSESLALERKYPLEIDRFAGIEEIGLYLHIPFCRQICPYCPYNKEIFNPSIARRYSQAVVREIDLYAEHVGGRPVTSFYIGGGTPTTMLQHGLERILNHIYATFNMQCAIHLESHPNDLTPDNLETIVSLGVSYLSVGVEALQDHHLQTLRRPYTVGEVTEAVGRAVDRGFHCVNADFIFALPGQSYQEVAQAGKLLVDLGVDQVASYPLFTFPYTQWDQVAKQKNLRSANLFTRRKMLGILEQIFYPAGYERTSVWAFTRRGVPKYCSVTVPIYLGLGASGASYLRDVFYLNTFNVSEYIRALGAGRLPIALSIELNQAMQMAGWLYWRIYETRFRKSEFRRRFGLDFDAVYGKYFRLLSLLGYVKDDGEQVRLSDAGAYWLHVLQDLFSLEYVSKLWGTSRIDPWPDKVLLDHGRSNRPHPGIM